MPNCFSLIRKSNPNDGPVKLIKIDEEICQFLGVDVHPDNWCYSWYDIIGRNLACDESFQEQILRFQKFHDESDNQDDKDFWNILIKIARWTDENFTFDSWYQCVK